MHKPPNPSLTDPTLSRKQTDALYLSTFNSNPRYSELTKSDIRRSESFVSSDVVVASANGSSPKENKEERFLRLVRNREIKKVNKINEKLRDNLSFSDVLDNPSFATTRKTQPLHLQSPSYSPSRAHSPHVVQQSHEDLYTSSSLLRPYNKTVQSTASHPPSFGHRPGSASRVYNPVSSSIGNSVKVKRKGNGKGSSSGILSSGMLKVLLQGGGGGCGGGGGGFGNSSYHDEIEEESVPSPQSFIKSQTTATTTTNLYSNLNTKYFNDTYTVPQTQVKPLWSDSLFPDYIKNGDSNRPLLLLDKDINKEKTQLEKIERYRRLPSNDTMAYKSEWKEELDKRFNSRKNEDAKRMLTPRSRVINDEIVSILRKNVDKEEELEMRVRTNDRWRDEERRERILNRGRKVDGGNGGGREGFEWD